MTTTTPPAIPMASNQGEQGSAKRGAHHWAYMGCPKFDLNATLELVPGLTPPWHPRTLGANFRDLVLIPCLANGPVTVGEVIAYGAAQTGAARHTAREIQNHLRWLYTWGGGAYLMVNGQRWGQTVAEPTPAPVNPFADAPLMPVKKAKAKKAKASA